MHEPMPVVEINGVTFSPDFRVGVFAGEVFEFSKQQAAIIAVIASAHQSRLPAVHGDTILSAIFPQGHESPRVDHAFKSSGAFHPAWGRLVVRCGRNIYCIGDFKKPPKSPSMKIDGLQ